MADRANPEIRAKIEASGYPFWKIAYIIGISEFTLTRWLRVELTDERKAKVLEAIEKITK